MADGSIIIDTQVDSSGLGDGLSKLGNFASGGLKVAGTAIAGIATALSGAAVAAVKTGMTFDASMAQVAATMGTTVDSISDLRQTAIDLGADTVFSATEAAQALNYLALAGYDAEKAAAVLPAVLDLAAAGGLDLAYASDLATDAMAALGIAATGENLVAFGDQLAKTASSANTSVAQLGEAILTVGGTAKMLAGGTVELNTVLGELANRGIKGSEAGTNLRNILLALSAPTDKAATALSELGVSAVDSAGSLRPMQDIFTDLGVAMEGMSESAKQQYLSQIFNRYDLAAAQALLAGCTEEWSELEGKIKEADGAMAQMADTQLDNLKGDVENLSGALESLGISVYDGVLPQLRELTQLGTSMIDSLTDAMRKGGFKGLAKALGGVLAQAITHVTGYAPKVIGLATDVLNSLADGLSSNAGTIADGIASVLTVAIGGIANMLPTLTTAGIQIASQLVTSFGNALPELIPQVISGLFDSIVSLVSNADQLLAAGGALVNGLIQGLVNSGPALAAGVGNLLGAAFGEAIELIEFLNWDSITGFIKNALGGLGEWLSSVFSIGKDFAAALPWSDVSSSISTAFDAVPTAITDAFVTGKTDAEALTWSEVGNSIKTGVMTALDTGGNAIEGWFTAGKAAVEAIDWTTLGTTIGDAFEGIVDVSGDFLSAGFVAARAAIESIDWSGIGTNIASAFNNLVDTTGEFISSGFTVAHATIEAIDWNGIGQQIGSAFNGVIDATGAFISGGFIAAQTTIESIDWVGIGEAISGAYNGIIDSTGAFISGGFTTAAETISGIDWAGIGSSIADGLNRAWGIVSGIGSLALGVGETIIGAGQAGLNVVQGWLGMNDTAASGTGTAEGQMAASNIASGFSAQIPVISQAGTDAATALAEAFASGFASQQGVISESVTLAVTTVAEILSPDAGNLIGNTFIQAVVTGIDDPTLVTTGQQLATAVVEVMSTGMSADAGLSIGTIFTGGVVTGIDGADAIAAGTTLATAVVSTISSIISYSAGSSIGSSIAAGVAAGIRSGTGSVVSAANALASAAVSGARSTLGINSPSKVFAELGMYCAEGLTNGLVDSADSFIGAYKGLLDGAKQYAASSTALESAAQRMQLVVDTQSQTPQGTAFGENERNLDYAEMARAFWAEAPEDLGGDQIIHFHEKVETPDETARAIRKANTAGLAGGKS